MHLLRTPKNLFDERTLKVIYYTHIQSHIDYGLILWGSMTTKENLNRMQMIQNKCIEIICNNKNIEHSFKKLKIPKIKELIKLQEIKIGYRLINKQIAKIKLANNCDMIHTIKVLIKHTLAIQEASTSPIYQKLQDLAISTATFTNILGNSCYFS